jgi:hypothetical protein
MPRKCTKCGVVKDLEEFYLNCFGRNGACKTCVKEKNRQYYAAKKERIKAQHAEVRADRKAGLRDGPDVGALQKRHEIDFKERYAERRAKVNARAKERNDTELEYQVAKRMDDKLRKAFLSWGSALEEIVGCSVAFFEEWVEYLFAPDMTWENYGTVWSYDHAQPRSMFDLSDREQAARCNHWSNLRPIHRSKNSSKYNKIDEELISVQAMNAYIFEVIQDN